MTAGTLTASPFFAWGATRTRTGRPRKAATPTPHWKAVLRWSLEWPLRPGHLEYGERAEHEQVVGRWWVRVA